MKKKSRAIKNLSVAEIDAQIEKREAEVKDLRELIKPFSTR